VKVRQSSQLTAYMLVNNATDLQNVSTNVGGIYALGRDIDAGSIPNFAPIPNFTGLFDGQGQTIANLTIASTTQNVGLFSSIGSAGVVRNLNLTDVAVSALNSQFVGALAGTNAGTISNISATGIVQVGSGSTAGGLVGQNLGSISNSFASVAVGSPSVANLQAGGLVGNNSGAILLPSPPAACRRAMEALPAGWSLRIRSAAPSPARRRAAMSPSARRASQAAWSEPTLAP